MTLAKSEANSAVPRAKLENVVEPTVVIDNPLLFLLPLDISAVTPKRSLRDMGQAIAQGSILTGPLAEKSTPRFRSHAHRGIATDGKVALPS